MKVKLYGVDEFIDEIGNNVFLSGKDVIFAVSGDINTLVEPGMFPTFELQGVDEESGSVFTEVGRFHMKELEGIVKKTKSLQKQTSKSKRYES